ncbi:MAG: lytic transglycosylase domain-containing protein [Clostridia bacterium]|nr:lytic transglycosylase domain-containing protein [Clostridia bacterium]
MIIRFTAFKRFFLIITISLILIFLFVNVNFFLKFLYPFPYRDIIYRYSKQFDLDPFLVVSVIKVESRFNPYAESQQGALGLMQIMPETALWVAKNLNVGYSKEKLFEPEYNIMLGCWYLSNLHSEFKGNLALVLASYNGGRGNVREWLRTGQWDGNIDSLEDIPFSETRDFVKKVLKIYDRYKKIYYDRYKKIYNEERERVVLIGG